ncbi:MAG: hypothetical protein J3R72DRAFT_456198 [Linnemannia gamsii]|nr:MAG: hypothetical protein J3R72DRAFT_456198 [Linnemannia gamsii]
MSDACECRENPPPFFVVFVLICFFVPCSLFLVPCSLLLFWFFYALALWYGPLAELGLLKYWGIVSLVWKTGWGDRAF